MLVGLAQLARPPSASAPRRGVPVPRGGRESATGALLLPLCGGRAKTFEKRHALSGRRLARALATTPAHGRAAARSP